MKIANILTNNYSSNSRAFNYPLLLNWDLIRDLGFHLQFKFLDSIKKKQHCLEKISPAIFDCDFLILNSKVFKHYWASEKPRMIRFLQTAGDSKTKLIWFDISDSTWSTQFAILPYVGKYCKNQLLVDRDQYLLPNNQGRVFCAYFRSLYNSGDQPGVEDHVSNKGDLAKISLGWNSSLENYDSSRYGLLNRFHQRLLRPLHLGHESCSTDFTPPASFRNLKVSYRVGLHHKHESIAAHRREISTLLEPFGVSSGKIPFREYFKELTDCKISIGPFGYGELTLRDFEIIRAGSTLMKPSSEHMSTWPDLLKEDETFSPVKWDLSDLQENIEYLLNHDSERIAIAENAQKRYKYYFTIEGRQEFCERFKKILLS